MEVIRLPFFMEDLKYNSSSTFRINTKMYIIPQIYRTHKLWTITLFIVLLFWGWYLFQYFYLQYIGHFYWIKDNNVTRLIQNPYFGIFHLLDILMITMLLFLKAQYFKKIARWFCILTFPLFFYHLLYIGGMPLYILIFLIVSVCLDKNEPK